MNRKKNKPIPNRSVDLSVISVANLFNILMVVIFYLRTTDAIHPLVIGCVWVLLIVILAAVTIINKLSKRSWWNITFPLIFAVFLIVELLLDYILQIDFRNTSLLAPYLVLYYASILGMIGYSFLTEKRSGIITLITYFLSQIAAIYAYLKVGHG